jgi:hypothetical protein
MHLKARIFNKVLKKQLKMFKTIQKFKEIALDILAKK